MKQPWGKTIVFVLALALIVVACSPAPTAMPSPTQAPPPPPTAQIKSPEEVIKAVAEAVNKKDVEAATALLAEDVTQTLIPAPSGTGIYKGKETMRARFKEVVALNAYHKFGKCETSGDQVTCAVMYSDDSTKPLGFDLEMKVEAVVQNGLLKTVTWAMTDASLAKMQAAMANTQPQAITLTFTKDKCTFGGPMRVPAGETTVNIKAEGDAYYGLFIATFDKGKTLDDLDGLPVVPQPDWVHEVDKVEFSTDRTMVTTVRQGPIYLICFNLTGTWTPIGRFGPIEVGK
jgi:ketosteroid isomerase-like protein